MSSCAAQNVRTTVCGAIFARTRSRYAHENRLPTVGVLCVVVVVVGRHFTGHIGIHNTSHQVKETPINTQLHDSVVRLCTTFALCDRSFGDRVVRASLSHRGRSRWAYVNVTMLKFDAFRFFRVRIARVSEPHSHAP